MRIAAIVNPRAGRHSAVLVWPSLLRAIGRQAETIETFWSEYPGHSEAVAASIRRHGGYDRVIAVGGDGTLFEVLNGLWWENAGRMPSVAMVPMGTGCDYIRNFHAGKMIAERLKTAISESTVKVSLGKCAYREQGKIRQRVFAMVLGLGFDAEVVRKFKSANFQRSGFLPYALSALFALGDLRPFSLAGHIDSSPFHADAIFFAAAIGRWFGKGMKFAPGASPMSAEFEFVIARKASPLSLLPPICRAYLGLRDASPGISRLKAKRAMITSTVPITFEADGELLGKTSEIEIQQIPQAFLFAAKGSPA